MNPVGHLSGAQNLAQFKARFCTVQASSIPVACIVFLLSMCIVYVDPEFVVSSSTFTVSVSWIGVLFSSVSIHSFFHSTATILFS